MFPGRQASNRSLSWQLLQPGRQHHSNQTTAYLCDIIITCNKNNIFSSTLHNLQREPKIPALDQAQLTGSKPIAQAADYLAGLARRLK